MPTQDKVQQIVQQIQKSAANYRYFFEKLDSPDWLEPLQKEGLFKNPPDKQEVEGGFLFPGWPASEYLARMAKQPDAQKRVADIALATADTDNIHVHSDLLDIALALPASEAARFVGKAKSWIKTPVRGPVAYKLPDLIVHLADGGQGKAALQMADAFLELRPEETEEAVEEKQWTLRPDLRAWLDDWHYDQILKKSVPALTKAAGMPTLRFLSRLLDTALKLSRRSPDADRDDFSYIWHEDLAHDEQHPQLRNSIVAAVRVSCELQLGESSGTLTDILAVLRQYSWAIFKRMELHLLTTFPESDLGERIRIARELGTLDDPQIEPEAAQFLKVVFPALPPEVQADILDKFAQGPGDDAAIRWLKFIEVEPTAARISQFLNRWRANRFSLLEGNLSPDWIERAKGYGAPDPGAANLHKRRDHGAVWVGPASPKSLEDLSVMGPDEVIAFLQQWQPKRGFAEDTPEGLGRMLDQAITSKPHEYAARAEMFRALDPTYVRSLFSGLREAAKKHLPFDWKPVLELARWVVQQPREIFGRKRALMEADPDWQRTRSAIADLIEIGLEDRKTTIPIESRPIVWAILKPLTSDPDPTPEHEEKYGGDNMEPATMAINTVRGKTFYALVQYGLWIRRDLDKSPANVLPKNFDSIPEMREVLNAHLNPEIEGTLTVHSVYGRFFPWFVLLDHDWSERSIPLIFPEVSHDQARFEAAWESYVVFCKPFKAMLPLMLSVYQRAVLNLKQPSSPRKHPPDPRERLADHLIDFYGWGHIGLTSPDHLIPDFFENAADELRAHAIANVGQLLANTAHEVPKEILNRLRELWIWRLQTARSSGLPDTYHKELSSFGWWFASGKFDAKWGLEQTEVVLRITGTIDPDFSVLEKLSSLAAQFPLECVRCVAQIASGDRKGWTLMGNSEHVSSVLSVALASSSVDAKAIAEELIDHLVAKGLFEFRKLRS